MKATKQSWSEVGPRPAQENKLLMFLLCYCNVTDTDVILQDKEWFAGECNRKIAEDLLLRINKVNRHFLFVAFFPVSFAQILLNSSTFSYRRMVPFSSDTAPAKTPGSHSHSLCSTSRRCTIFPYASWRRYRVMSLGKRARRMKR